MGSPSFSKMSTKLLLAAFALLAVANATDVYTSGWTYEGPLCSGHCAGNPSDSVKFTLAKCTYVDSLSLYTMISSVTGGYTWQSFSDASCSTLTGINDGLSVDTCTEHPGTSYTPCVQVLRAGSGYASGATNTYDCTSGTCGDCITCSASHATIGIMAILVGLAANLLA